MFYGQTFLALILWFHNWVQLKVSGMHSQTIIFEFSCKFKGKIIVRTIFYRLFTKWNSVLFISKGKLSVRSYSPFQLERKLKFCSIRAFTVGQMHLCIEQRSFCPKKRKVSANSLCTTNKLMPFHRYLIKIARYPSQKYCSNIKIY